MMVEVKGTGDRMPLQPRHLDRGDRELLLSQPPQTPCIKKVAANFSAIGLREATSSEPEQ